jgi:hypothetical protein
MNSSISSSEAVPPLVWRWFLRRLLLSALALAVAIYLFVFIMDPFDTLPLSPPFDRTPIATNARYSFPALARKPEFDSVIIGTSTSRLLRPDELDRLFDARFVNLAMNSATAYEQERVGTLFARHHPKAKVALIGLDTVWCQTPMIEKYTERSFPEWMYDDDPWNDYLEQFTLYAVEQAGVQFGVLTGLRPRPYGRDGYTNFLPDDAKYDVARARAKLYENGRTTAAVDPPEWVSDEARRALVFPALPLLRALLESLPATLKIVFFVPYHVTAQPRPGSRSAVEWAECKTQIAALVARIPQARLVDFMIASPVTREDGNYWDPLHYRVAIASWLARSLRAAAEGPPRHEQEGYDIPLP